MRLRRAIPAVLVLALAACGTSFWVESADREVGRILAERQAEFDRFRQEEVVRPAGAEAPAAGDAEEDLADVPPEVGLAEALRVAVRRNRNYLAERESLYLAALSLTRVLNDFSPFFTGSLSAVLSDTNSSRHLNENALSVGVTQILPTGGTLGLSGRAAAGGGAGDSEYALSSSVTASLSQPLLRDAGYETSHEALTQAERNVVYAIRDFELFREDFTIQVTSEYYSLVRQMQEIENAERNLQGREFLKQQSESKFEVGLATEVDKLRATREFYRAQTDLLSLRESFQLALDRFKIRLGLPTSFPLTIRPEWPTYRDEDVDLEKAVQAALHNRVDLITLRDRIEDAERDVRIQLNRLLPDLDLDASYTRSAPEENRFGRQNWSDEAYSIGLTLSLPLERTTERNNLRRSLIDRDRAVRDLTLGEDNVVLEVRNSLRQLRRARTSLEIRELEVGAAEKEARAAQIRFEAGEMDNRDVNDAADAVLRARNAYIQELVEYEVSRIQLFRDLGLLFLDENGMWLEP